MLMRFSLIVIFLLNLLMFQSAQAEDFPDDPPPPAKNPIITKAKIRGDGMLIDNENFIIGIRNIEDPRADEYTLYYLGVNREGRVSKYSMYKVYQNPEAVTADFLQESLFDYVEDNSEIIAKSNANGNAIFLHNDKIFFNGEILPSGSVAEGGIVTLVNKKLYYNGEQIQSGTVVSNGKIVQVVN